MQLARRKVVCLIKPISVQSGRTIRGRGRIAGAALAGLLMFVLLVATACSASQALHQSFHHDSDATGHFCLVCFFAKGHVSAASVALVAAAVAFHCLGSVALARTAALSSFDYRLSPSRAPPLS